MKRLVLVAGTNHQKIAIGLQRAFLNRRIHVLIVTQNTSPTNIPKYLKAASYLIWLVSPQTIKSNRYRQLRKYSSNQKIPSLPIIVQPVEKLPFKHSGIDLQDTADQTVNLVIEALKLPAVPVIARTILRTSHWMMASAIIAFLIVSILAGLGVVSMQTEDLMPTLVALEPMSIMDVTQALRTTQTEPLQAAQSSETPDAETQDITMIAVSSTQVEAEVTEIVEPISHTAESTEEPTIQSAQVLTANFTVSVTRGDAPLTIELINGSTGNITGYSWDYETDGTVDSSEFEPPPVIYQTPGVYTITLSIRDVDGAIVQSQNVIEVYDSIESDKTTVTNGRTFASFASSPSSGKFPLNVQFINRSEGADLRYEWDFDGDGKVDFVGASPPSHEYKKAGSYTARLIAIAEDGNRDEAKSKISVYSTEPDEPAEVIYDSDAQANFDVSVTSGKVPFRVSINNLSTGENNSYEWDFNGDGIVDSAAEQPAEQRYAEPGIYPILLTVYGFDRYGVPKVSRAQVQITALPRTAATATLIPTQQVTYNTELEADFVASETEGDAPLLVEFLNFSIGDATSYQWDFDDDGEIDSTAFEPSYTFTSGGEYVVTLRISDGVSTSESQLTIVVHAASATLQPSPTYTPSLTHTVTPSSTPTATPGNVVIVSSATPSPTYTKSATPTPTLTHTLTLTLTSTPTSSATRTLTPTATPSATITLTPTFTYTPSVTPSSTLTFTATNTLTYTPTPTVTPTLTYTPTSTNTPTDSPTPTPSDSPGPESAESSA